MFIVVTYRNFVKSTYFRDCEYVCEIVFNIETARELKNQNSLSRAYRLYDDNIQDILKQYNTEMQKELADHDFLL